MKKISILFIMLMSMIGLTACVNANANASDTSDGDKTTIKKEEPFTLSLEDIKKKMNMLFVLQGEK